MKNTESFEDKIMLPSPIPDQSWFCLLALRFGHFSELGHEELNE